MSNILLIEDEDSIRRVLKKVLQEDNQSYKFTEATDGQEGISNIKKQEFDLILCDIKMPKKVLRCWILFEITRLQLLSL